MVFPDPFPNLIKVFCMWTGNTTQFKIKTSTALKKLMSRYCERNAFDVQVYKKLCFALELFVARVSGS